MCNSGVINDKNIFTVSSERSEYIRLIYALKINIDIPVFNYLIVFQKQLMDFLHILESSLK